MASIVGKKFGGRTYYYLREMARVGGKPKMVSERYLGEAADIEVAMAGATVEPERTRHLAFGDLAAVWAMCHWRRERTLSVEPPRVPSVRPIATARPAPKAGRLTPLTVTPCPSTKLALGVGNCLRTRSGERSPPLRTCRRRRGRER